MKELTLADVVRLAVAVVVVMTGAAVIKGDTMSDFLGATLVVVGVVYLVPVSRRQMTQWCSNLREMLRKG